MTGWLDNYIDKRLKAAIPNVKEQGLVGSQVYWGYIDDGEFNSEWQQSKKYDLIEKMIRTDAQVNAVRLAVQLMFLQATVDVEPASDDPKDEQIADECKKALFQNPAFQWSYVHQHILRHLDYGFYPIEKSPFMHENKLYFKLSPRKPETIKKWHQNDDGTLKTVEQFAMVPNGGYVTKIIENERLLLFNVGQEGFNWEGVSLLRPIYRNWKAKDLLTRLDLIAQDKYAVPPLKITLPENEKDGDKEQAEEVGENYRSHERGYIVVPYGWDVDILERPNASNASLMASLEYHNKEITGAYLANFLLVGMMQVGTRNVTESKQDFFTKSIEAYAGNIEDVINENNNGRSVIKHFVDWNFQGVKKYPKFKYSNIQQIDFDQFADTLQKFTSAGYLAPRDEDREWLIRNLGLPETGTEIVPKKEKIVVKKDKEVEEEMPTTKAAGCDCGEIHFEDGTPDEFVFWRDLTDFERDIVELADIRNKLNEFKGNLGSVGTKYRKETINTLVEQGKKYLARNSTMAEFTTQINEFVSNVTTKNRWLKQGAFTTDLTREMKNIYGYGSQTVKTELMKQGVKLSAEDTILEEGINMLRSLADLIVNAYSVKIVSEWKKELTKQKTLGLINLERLLNLLTGLSGRELTRDLNETVLSTFGQGRTNFALKHKDKISRVVRSEIMDNRICSECRPIDQKEFTVDDPFWSLVAAGPYLNCKGGNLCRGVNFFVAGE